MRLQWNECAYTIESKLWLMPSGILLQRPVPTSFGIKILRVADDRYIVNVVWDRTGFAWEGLCQEEIRNSDLADLLNMLGTDLENLLNQPVIDDLSEILSSESSPAILDRG